MALFYIPQAVRIDSTGAPYAGAKAHFYLTGTTTNTNVYTDSALGTPHANPVVADAEGQWAAIYLDPAITYRCIIKTSADVTLDDVDPVFAPIGADEITVDDTGGYFAGTEVETILADIGANYGKTTRADTWTADQTFSNADIKMADNIIERPEIKDFGVTHNNVVQSPSGTITFDLTTGNSFYHLLTANITTMNLNNPPLSGTLGQINIILQQDSAGGGYTVTWDTAVKWPGGTAPTMTATNNALDQVTLTTIDGGTTWFGNFSQAYS